MRFRCIRGGIIRNPADAAYAQLRAEAAGSPIGGNDMLIAAQAIATDCTVVTDNEREHEEVWGAALKPCSTRL
jgi:tRNA(fMet)-specific endonuclease VapC